MMPSRMAAFATSTATVAAAVLLNAGPVMAVRPAHSMVDQRTTKYLRTAARWRAAFLSSGSETKALSTVAAISPKDAWVAGAARQGSHESPLVLRWNGSRWRSVRVPGIAGAEFLDVAASSGSNVWLSGPNLDTGKSVVRRWDGRRWHSIPPPPESAVRVVLGPADAWAEGTILCVHSRKHCRTALEHWNGRSWSRFTIPTFVDQISGSASGNVWAVGEFGGDPSPPATPGRPVAFRWNGKSWRAVTSMPHPLSFLPARIAVASPRNVWITARKATSSSPVYALHWNGTRWRRITAPARLNTSGPLQPEGRGVWLGPDAHWTGKRWINTTPGHFFAGGQLVNLFGMALIPGTQSIWAVGQARRNNTALTSHALIAIYGTLP